MSGTSLDGIDVAIVEVQGRRIRTIGFLSTPYTEATRAAILAVSDATTHTSAISRLNFQLAELYARAVLRAVRRFGPVDLIGCHGQTVYHQGGLFPRARYRRRRPGRAAGPVRRLPALSPRHSHAHCAQHRRHCQHHHNSACRRARRCHSL
jgi:1,6-anhydro-N-acetylmuramate kinase